MRIEEAGEADAAQVIALWRLCGLTRPWNDPAGDFALARRTPTSAVLAGWEADAMLATAMVGGDGHRGWVYYLAVAPHRRGEGLGRNMMRAAEDWAGARGVPKLQLMVRNANMGAMGFFDALGYEREEVAVFSRWLAPAGPSRS